MPLCDALVLDEEGADEQALRLAGAEADDVGLALLVGVGAQHKEICLRQVQHSDAGVAMEKIGGGDVGDAAGAEPPRRPLAPRIRDLAEEHESVTIQFTKAPAARVSADGATSVSPTSNRTCTSNS